MANRGYLEEGRGTGEAMGWRVVLEYLQFVWDSHRQEKYLAQGGMAEWGK